MQALIIIYLLIFMIITLIIYSVMQIKLAGLEVKDFLSFIRANQTLDNLYKFSRRYDKLSPQEQVIFLKEAETMFDAFDKIPNIFWEEEYAKYSEVLNKYKDIKVMRWSENLK